jgi:hypothetical protein
VRNVVRMRKEGVRKRREREREPISWVAAGT